MNKEIGTKNSKFGAAVSGKMTIGLDLGDAIAASTRWTVREKIQSRGGCRRRGAEKRFQGCEAARVVIEAGTHSPWVSRLLSECGHEVVIANPHKLALIAENEIKDEAVDAELLARLGRVVPRLLSSIVHRGARAQADLAVIRARDAMVAARTRLVNHGRGAAPFAVAVDRVGNPKPTASINRRPWLPM